MPTPEQSRLNSLAEDIAEVLRRQAALEKRLAKLEVAVFREAVHPTPEAVAQPAADPPEISTAVASVVAPVEERPVTSQPAASKQVTAKPALETKVGLTILNRVGVVTLVLGIAFFFKWAADNDWIGPSGRVMLGVVAGFAALLVADILWRKGQQVFAQGITGTGIAVLYLSLYASFGFYRLILQWFAFLLLFTVTAMAVSLSLRYGAQAIACLGLFGAYLTPLLLSTGEDRPWFLFGYLLLLNAAAMLLARKRKWRAVEFIAFAATVLIYASWLLRGRSGNKERLIATLAPLAYYAVFSRISFRFLFFIAQFLTALAMAVVWQDSAASFFSLALLIAAGGLAISERKRLPAGLSAAFVSFWLSYAAWEMISALGEGVSSRFIGISLGFLLFYGWQAQKLIARAHPVNTQRLSVLVLNAIVYYGSAYSLLHRHERAYLGFLAVLVAAAYVALGVYLYRRQPSKQQDVRPVLLSLGIALCLLTLAIPIQFTGFTITLAWALQAGALAWIGSRLRSYQSVIASLAIFALAIIRVVMFDSQMYADSQSHVLFWNSRFLTFVVLGVSLLMAARWSQRFRQVALGEYFAGHFALLFGLILEVVDWSIRSTPAQNLLSVETVSISVLLGVYAVLLIVLGVVTRTALNRITGLGLIGLVILKLYLFDVWQLGRGYRISAFVLLGGLLIGTSFLYSRFRRLVESWWKDDERSS